MALVSRNFADLITYARAGIATRINAQGLIETVAANAPRFNFDPVAKAPLGLLVEEARTNAALYSTFAGGGSAPTGWTQPGATGTSTAVASVLGAESVAYTQTATAERPYLASIATFPVAANTTYVASTYIEAVSGSPPVNNVFTLTALPAGATVAYRLNGVPILESAALTQTGRLEMILVVAATAGTVNLRLGLGASSNSTGSVTFSRPQFEQGAFATSYIPTTTVAVTRAGDEPRIIVPNFAPWFNPAEGTFLAQFDVNGVDTSIRRYAWFINDSGNQRLASRALDAAINYPISIVGSGSSNVNLSGSALTANVLTKLATAYGSDMAQVQNGGAPVTNATPAVVSGTEFRIGNGPSGSQLNGHIRSIRYFPKRLTNAQLQALTA